MRKTGGREDGRTGREKETPVFPSSRLPVYSRFRSAVKRITGMPDYPGYLAHMAERHGDCSVLTEREYYDQYVSSRYGNGASRCC